MNIAEIRNRITSGFKPFIIRTSDGREFKVPHPEFLAIGKYAIAVVGDDGCINTIAPLHIASIRDFSVRGKKPKQAA